MNSTQKLGGAVIAFCLFGIALVGRAQADSPAGTITGGYDAANDGMFLTVNNLTSGDFTGVTLTETLLADPTVTDTIDLGSISAGSSRTLNTASDFPATFGNNPDDVFIGSPFSVSVGATYGGATKTVTFSQTSNATGGFVQFEGIGEGSVPIDDLSVAATPLAALPTPEPGPWAIVLGVGLTGLQIARRRVRR